VRRKTRILYCALRARHAKPAARRRPGAVPRREPRGCRPRAAVLPCAGNRITAPGGSRMNAVIAPRPAHVPKDMTDAEWETRVHLAACYRLVARNGWDDLTYTHISAAVPGPKKHFLINPYGMLF